MYLHGKLFTIHKVGVFNLGVNFDMLPYSLGEALKRFI